MFLLGLFTVLGVSPSSLIFDELVNAMSPLLQAAILVLLIVAVYLIYDQVVVPLRQMYKAYRWGGIMAATSLCLAFLGGYYLLVDELGMVLLIISLALWKLTVYQFRRKRR
ncbi:MAG: hypothetical protein A4E29_01280 [Methanomassiliicoccales archaeon PtaB.Bin134]|jgi:O-antigen/teichoic acid export membrane protein|nr:MAG: hypothetical protein A4E29_01280 [Methanomassiliicoccales archaeon PtaB.Bin134]